MYEIYTYDSSYYDSIESGIIFNFRYLNTFNGELIFYNVNYLDNISLFATTINEINDNVSAELYKEAYKLHKFGIKEVLDKEESLNKFNSESTFVVYGIKFDGSLTQIPIIKLSLSSFERNFRGRTHFSIGKKYYSGREVSPTLYDDFDNSPSILERQVMIFDYYDRNGHNTLEYAGTPRQIIHYLIGGLPFIKEELHNLVYNSINIENEKDIYDDGRIKPGDYFNDLWINNFDDVIALVPMEISVIDSNNAPMYSFGKSLVATIDIVTNKILKLFDSFYISSVNKLDYSIWNNIINTKIYQHLYTINKQSQIVYIDYDLYNNINYIELNSTYKWPDFGFIRIGNELIQYRKLINNKIYDLDRHIRGIKNNSISIGDTVSIAGSVKKTEKESAWRARLKSLLGHKETISNLNQALFSILSNDSESYGKVFDMNIENFNTYEYSKWLYPRKDIGWFLDSYGSPSIKNCLSSYTKSTKTIVLSELLENISNIHTGDTIRIKYGGDDEWSDGIVFSIDYNTNEIVLIDQLLDNNNIQLDDFSNKKTIIYSVGSETKYIISSNTTNKLITNNQTALGKIRETTGYFHHTYDIASIYYETSVNQNEVTLNDLIASNDTSVYTERSYEVIDYSIILQGTNQAYDYTGRVKSYSFSELKINPIKGNFPFIVLVNDWNFNNYILYDTFKEIKTIGTTPNYIINKEFNLWKTNIANEHSVNVNMTFCYSNE